MFQTRENCPLNEMTAVPTSNELLTCCMILSKYILATMIIFYFMWLVLLASRYRFTSSLWLCYVIYPDIVVFLATMIIFYFIWLDLSASRYGFSSGLWLCCVIYPDVGFLVVCFLATLIILCFMWMELSFSRYGFSSSLLSCYVIFPDVFLPCR